MSINYRKCPNCNSNNGVPIKYGEPTYETCLENEERKCVIGGCLIEVDENGKHAMDEYHCKDCSYEYGKSKFIDAIYSKIESIKGYVGGYFQGDQYFEIIFMTGEVFYSKGYGNKLDLIKTLNKTQKDKLLQRLKAVKVLSWKKKYINQDISDGTQWRVIIDVNGRKREKIGSNMYPKEWPLYCKIISKILKEDFS